MLPLFWCLYVKHRNMLDATTLAILVEHFFAISLRLITLAHTKKNK